MRAVICTRYGSADFLQLANLETPVPGKKDLIIRIHATTVSAGDIRVRKFQSPPLLWIPMRLVLGLQRPRNPVLGVEFAGEVVDCGSEVTQFQRGDRVFALTGMRFSAHAEYIRLPEHAQITHMPAGMEYEQAAALPYSGTSALCFLRRARIQPGQRVLIYGASGAVGTTSVQLAVYYGAIVTGVCGPDHVSLVREMGASEVLDYTQPSFREQLKRYDVVFDAVGKLPEKQALKVLVPGGTYITVDGQGMIRTTREDLVYIRERAEAGEIWPVIDRFYTLDEIPEAHRYVEQGHKKGNVVIRVQPPYSEG
ncbi:NAD(P)-dependent alcohol dehydrogenase [Paenibacillus bovis]|uniref:NADPH:quinone reductase n=1 Tax=Paenibacillus bovis TaxID=1616788 RepID=A0A172ZI06_9BACL|nr:NAD(P)-dependent alcohol dehydrogenase [Paenibacillus bovis]ANF97274.1 NADPH:quinone reductase [Paenibacillus bovis]